MPRSLPILTLTLVGSLHAQAASYRYLDQKTPYTNPPTATFSAQNLPKIGMTLKLTVPYTWVQRNRVGADFLLATGVFNPDVALPSLGGFLFTMPLIILPTPMSPLGIPGRTRMNFPIPNSAQLIGFNFYQQILEIPSSGSPRLSRGAHAIVGR